MVILSSEKQIIDEYILKISIEYLDKFNQSYIKNITEHNKYYASFVHNKWFTFCDNHFLVNSPKNIVEYYDYFHEQLELVTKILKVVRTDRYLSY